MNCLQAEEHFSAHFEDTLDYQTLQGFEEHLAECEACQHEYTQFQASVKATQQLPQIEPSLSFMSTLQQRLATEQREPDSVRDITATGWGRLLDVFKRQHFAFRRPRWALSGIIALMLAAVGTFFYQDGAFFNRDLRPASVAPVSQSGQIVTSSEGLPERLPRFSTDRSQFQQGSILSTPRQPTQRRYMLKQVSYTSASSSGGL
jgi:anti-sigma factor RsiW